MKYAFYQQTPIPLNIRLHPNELEILVPFAIDSQKHIYYHWRLIGSGYKYLLLVDTGNHAISGMSLKYFNDVYLGDCPEGKSRDEIRKIVLDRETPTIQTHGVGGQCREEHLGYVEMTFRLTQFQSKGNFTIDCAISKTEMYDLLIGDMNKPRSRLP